MGSFTPLSKPLPKAKKNCTAKELWQRTGWRRADNVNPIADPHVAQRRADNLELDTRYVVVTSYTEALPTLTGLQASQRFVSSDICFDLELSHLVILIS